MAKLTPLLETAKQILQDARKALHVKEMADIAVKSNRNFQLDVETLADRFASAMAANLNTKSPIFAKVKNSQGGLKRGIYKLKASQIGPRITIQQVPDAPPVNNNFMGRAGEHAVMAELLFWGFNSSLMAVDEGIDIVASKENRYFHLQVKTTSSVDGSTYGFKIDHKIFNNHNAANTFYIFVIRRRGGSEFAVIPSSHLHMLHGLGVIAGKNALSVLIATDAKRQTFSLNGTSDISLFINNFGLIK